MSTLENIKAGQLSGDTKISLPGHIEQYVENTVDETSSALKSELDGKRGLLDLSTYTQTYLDTWTGVPPIPERWTIEWDEWFSFQPCWVIRDGDDPKGTNFSPKNATVLSFNVEGWNGTAYRDKGQIQADGGKLATESYVDDSIKKYELSDIFGSENVELSSLRFFRIKAYYESKTDSPIDFYALSSPSIKD